MRDSTLDGIFKRSNFKNEIVWKRTSAHNRAKRFGPVHDTLLFYTASNKHTWNPVYQPYDTDYVEKNYRYEDEKGKYRIGDLTAPEVRMGTSGDPWRGYNPTDAGRHWGLPSEDTLPDWFKWPGNPESMSVQDRLDALDSRGLVYWPPKGSVPSFKRYLDAMKGVASQDVITDIANEGGSSEYQTKKPLDLLKRIVRVSTNEDDLVLDPFCGCGTTIEASHLLGRRWIGIDISGNAIDEIKKTLSKHGVYEDTHYELLEGSPDTMAEYKRLNPYEKQDWLVRRLNGLPNPKKSGDFGIDGELSFHCGLDGDGKDLWGKLVFSVKTGKQKSPAHVRELRGTMSAEDAQMGVLILDVDPTPSMERAAGKAGHLKYQLRANMPPRQYDRLQIITAYEVIEGGKIDCPPTMQEIKDYREKHQFELKV